MIKKYITFSSIAITLTASLLYNFKSHEHWSYNGNTSPEHWSQIEGNNDCNGKKQSPININEIETKKINNTMKPNINYFSNIKIHDVVNNGHTIQYNFNDGDFIQFQNKKFNLKQIHFHEPSEHTINGIRYPIEMHLVHKGDNEYTVISLLGKQGKKNTSFDLLEKYIPIHNGEIKTIEKQFDLKSALLNNNKDFYFYKGSLTTPPCSENVNWIIYKEPIELSKYQIDLLKKYMPENNYRNEQNLNNRIVIKNF